MASAPDTLPAGQDPPSHGRWTAGPLLGQGRLGRVFLAHDGTGRAAALRVVHASLARDQEFRARFAREVRALGAVRGRRVAALVDADPHGAVPWLATEYVPGPTLATWVRDLGGPLGTPDLRVLANALAGALNDIHRAGLVHGGLRPSNVLLATGGPRVVDFGVAGCAERAGDTGQAGCGAPAGLTEARGYTAPEVLASPRGETRPPSDVFSLGAVLAFAAAGRGPFDAAHYDSAGYDAAGYDARGEAADMADVPEELRPLITACLARHPTARPAPRTVARMAGLPLPGSRRRALTLAGTLTLTGTLLLAQPAAVAGPLGGRWASRTGER
ncbi:serine/threonine protein kinase [Streptomyces sp. NBC_01283]|uniref:serine/threonine-protein kinase n=1 Tax=Streptomyces sp. NBC_01283 TaxID=2903812 RepID=UPI00352CB0C9|nr:serine/threonine protein kinase [Streptomyces sp. NBC_01283]